MCNRDESCFRISQFFDDVFFIKLLTFNVSYVGNNVGNIQILLINFKWSKQMVYSIGIINQLRNADT